MNWDDIRTIFAHELRGAVREKNIVLYTFLVPALLYPLVVWMAVSAVSYMTGLHEKSVARVAIVEAPARYQSLVARFSADPQFRLVKSTDPASDLEHGRLEVAVEFDMDVPDKCKIVRDTSRTSAVLAAERVRSELQKYKDLELEQVAARSGLAVRDLQPFFVNSVNVASSQDLGKYLLGTLLPFTLILVLSLAGLYPAIDSTAGERERSTWETSMTMATSRFNLVAGKYLYVSSMAFFAGILNVIAMTFSLRSMLEPMIGDVDKKLVLTMSPVAMCIVVGGTALVSLMMSAVLMLVASAARTFREGQALVSPVFLLMVLPVSMVMDKSIQLNAYTGLIPIVNVALQWREAINGKVELSILTEILAVQLACTALCLLIANAMLKASAFGSDAHPFKLFWRRLRGRG